MDIDLLVNTTARAWTMGILAHLAEGVPGRQAALITATGASRTAFSQSLAHLINLGLVERNPGHGHPLRPEFRLTASGIEVARAAKRVKKLGGLSRQNGLIRRAWTLPILATSHEPRYFGQLKSALHPISDRALSTSLDRLIEHQWIRRDVDLSGKPLRPQYRAANLGAAISDVLGSSFRVGVQPAP